MDNISEMTGQISGIPKNPPWSCRSLDLRQMRIPQRTQLVWGEACLVWFPAWSFKEYPLHAWASECGMWKLAVYFCDYCQPRSSTQDKHFVWAATFTEQSTAVPTLLPNILPPLNFQPSVLIPSHQLRLIHFVYIITFISKYILSFLHMLILLWRFNNLNLVDGE